MPSEKKPNCDVSEGVIATSHLQEGGEKPDEFKSSSGRQAPGPNSNWRSLQELIIIPATQIQFED